MPAIIHNANETPATRWVTVQDHRAEVRKLQRVARQLLAKVMEAAREPAFTDEEITTLTTTTPDTEE